MPKLDLERMKNYLESDRYKKLQEKHIEGLNRTEKRQYQRREEKLKQCIKTLTPAQFELIEYMSDKKADDKIEAFNDILDRAMSALMIEYLPENSYDEIRKLQEYVSDLVLEDVRKEREFNEKMRGDNEMAKKAMEKLQMEVRTRTEELLAQGVNQKVAIETLVIEFPTLSKGMLVNAYKRVKSDWEKEQSESDPEVEEAAATIMEIIDEPKDEDDVNVDKIIQEADEYVKQAEQEQTKSKIVCEGNSCRIVENEVTEEMKEKKEVMSEVKNSGLKVLSMTVQGANGTYKVCSEGVELSNNNLLMSFENEIQFNEFVSEFKQVFSMMR